MPADFDKCVNDGGKVITKSLKDGKYIHVCYDKEGTAYPGEVKEKKSESTLLEKAKKLVDKLKDLMYNIKKA